MTTPNDAPSAQLNIDDLRSHLFATLTALRDKDAPMEIERAKAISEVAQTVINSARVEVEHMKLIGATGESKFLAGGKAKADPPLPPGITGRTVHRLLG